MKQIIVNLASGENYVISYTLENEKNLLERMKTQVLGSSVFEAKQEKRFSSNWKFAIFDGIMLVLDFIILVNEIPISIFTKILIVWFAFDIITRIYSMIDSKIKIGSIRKNKIFLIMKNR